MKNGSSPPSYLTGIDGLRALAVLGVILYPTGIALFLSGGYTGVDVLFVISGYLTARSLSRKPAARLSHYLLEFYRGRIVRIFPALIVCLVVTMTASALFIPPASLSSTNTETGLAAFLGFSNLVPVWHTIAYFSPRVEFNPFLHTWSLGIGEQFYLLFPLLFYSWLKPGKKGSVHGYLSQGLILGLALLSLAYACFETDFAPDRAFYLLPGRFWEPAAGALLFQLHSRDLCLPGSKGIAGAFLASGILLIGTGFVCSDQNAFPFPWAFAPLLGTLLSISGIIYAADRLSLLHKFLRSKWMTCIGRMSFSLYLWHWPVAALLHWTIGFDRLTYKGIYLILVFLLAAASYHFVELPVSANKRLLQQENWKLIVCGLAAVCASCFAAYYIDRSQSAMSLSVTRDRYTWYPWEYAHREPGEGSLDLAGRKLFVIGDSHAAAYRTMLAETASQLGVEVHIYEQGGCPVAGLLIPMSQSMLCKEYYDGTFAEVENLAKPNDIVFFASLRMPELSDQFEVVDEAAVIAEFKSAKASGYRQKALEEAGQLIEKFEARGLHVLIDAPLPIFKAPPYRCSDWFNRMNPICSPGLSMDRKVLLDLRQPVMDSLSTLEDRHPNLSVWDPFPILCKSETCSAYDGGQPLFFDGDHLSAHGNRVLAPSFITKLTEIWHR